MRPKSSEDSSSRKKNRNSKWMKPNGIENKGQTARNGNSMRVGQQIFQGSDKAVNRNGST